MVTIINVELNLDNGAKIQLSHTIRAKNATMMSVGNVLQILLNCRIERKRSKEKLKLARMRKQKLTKGLSLLKVKYKYIKEDNKQILWLMNLRKKDRIGLY